MITIRFLVVVDNIIISEVLSKCISEKVEYAVIVVLIKIPLYNLIVFHDGNVCVINFYKTIFLIRIGNNILSFGVNCLTI